MNSCSNLDNFDVLPFSKSDSSSFFICKPDVPENVFLKPVKINVTDNVLFTDRILPQTSRTLSENAEFPSSYFVDLHNKVKAFGVHNYKGARIPLLHNNINVEAFRAKLAKFNYPDIHLMQFIEFGFPLGLWSEAHLEPSCKNHSSAYSYYSHVDKFVETELQKIGVTGPFEKSPWDAVHLSPMMTAPKKPDSRRTVFDASFGIHSLNKNTPEHAYHDMEYEFSFPTIDNLADRIAKLGPGCFLWKRDLSRFFLQMKVDPLEYDRLGFVWREKLYLFVSFVWGCRHAGYVGQWLTTAVAYVQAHLGLELSDAMFFCLNYADDFAGCETEFTKSKLSFDTLGTLLKEINLTESESKACAPSTSMTYLGVNFNTLEMCMHVDVEKVKELKLDLVRWARKTVATKSDLQSILGKLLWVSKTVKFSRVFVSRIIAEVRKLKKQSDKVVLSTPIRKDFLWWDSYIQVFSGVEIIPPPSVKFSVYGDACVQGGGGWFPGRNEYFSLRFPISLSTPDVPIHIKEFYVVILIIKLWGSNWIGHRIEIYCDNDAVCDTCTHQKPANSQMQQLLREFLFWICKFNIHPIVKKIGTKENFVADFVSRVYTSDETKKFFKDNGYPLQTKKLIPDHFFDMHADW